MDAQTRKRGSLETHCPVWKLFHVESADGPKTLSVVDSNRREDVDDRNMLMTAEEAKRREHLEGKLNERKREVRGTEKGRKGGKRKGE